MTAPVGITAPTGTGALTARSSGSPWPGVALLGIVALGAWAVSTAFPTVSPLVAGVALGALVVNVVRVPDVCRPGVERGGRRLLRIGIVLLGLRLSLGDLANLGVRGLGVVAVVVAATFFGTRWLARRLGVPDDLGLLVATGYSICGASAIAAMDGVVGADEEETAYAITLVTLCGTLAIFVLPVLGGPLGLHGDVFGSWVGGSVHDVGQVIATASHGGASAIAAATVVKLTRIVLLAPLVAGVALTRRRAATAAGDLADAGEPSSATRPPILPLFVVGFLAAIVVRSSGVLPAGALDVAGTLEKIVLTMALVGLGMGVRLDRMRRLGGRPLVLGLLSWVLVALAAYVGTIAVH
jgi:uncharacterized integral membrane protein (TIGR00698 family)